jgi:hypothetical protein
MVSHHAQEVSMNRPLVFAAAGVFALGLAAPAAATPVQSRGSVHINFVRYDPAGSDTGSNINKEVVVIKNSTGKARILTGWTLRDRCACGHVYHFPQTRLRPGHSVTVHTGKGHDRPGQRYWGKSWYVWNNDGDRATLRTASFKLIDRCRWRDGDGTTGC